MVSKCFIYGCTKYQKGLKNPTFGVPKDPDLLQKWADVLRPYSNGKTLLSRHRICHKHFKPEDLECYYVHLIHGTEIKIEKDRPTLRKGTVPTIFPGLKKDERKVVKGNGNEKLRKKSIKKHVPARNKEVRQKSNPMPLELVNTVEFPVFVENLSSVEDEEALIAKYQLKRDDDSQPCNSSQSKSSSPEVQVLPDETLHQTEPSSHNKAPPDKEVCVNWDALPLPEEIGAFFCSSDARAPIARGSFCAKLPKENSFSPNALKSQAQSAQHKSINISSSEGASEPSNKSSFVSLLSNKFKSLLTENTQLKSSRTSKVIENSPEPSHKELQSPCLNGPECPVTAFRGHKPNCPEDFSEESQLQASVTNAPIRISKPVDSSAEHVPDIREDFTQESPLKSLVTNLPNGAYKFVVSSVELKSDSTEDLTEDFTEVSSLQPPIANVSIKTLKSLSSSPERECDSSEDITKESVLEADTSTRAPNPIGSSAEHDSIEDFKEESLLQPPIANIIPITASKPVRSLQRKVDRAATENATRNVARQDIENIPLSFLEFQKRFTELKLPSSLWATHKNRSCVFFSLLAFESHGYRAVPRVERIVMYEGSMRPRLFLRATEVRVPSISEKDSDSMLAVFDVLCQVEDLRLCLGINKADGVFSVSSDCDVFLDSVKVPRCTACRKERENEYKKKRHLENDESSRGYRSRKRR